MTEQQLQNKVIKYLQAKGAYVVKVISANRSGIPDLLACYKGKFIALEIKAGSKLTELQKYNINNIAIAGGIAAEVTDIKDVELLLQLINKKRG